MFGSTTKKLLLSLILLSLSGCGAPIVGDSSSSGSSGSSSSLSPSIPSAPKVSVVTQNNSFVLNWDESSAHQYRVLYWQDSDAPQEGLTSATTFTLPRLGRGEYTVLVEAYDEMGNSSFSSPVELEVV